MVVHNVDALELLGKALLVTLHLVGFLTQEENFRVRFTDHLLLVFLVLISVRVEGELGKTRGESFILGLQAVNFILGLGDGCEQLRVGLLTREELTNQLLYISHLSSGLNSFESIINILGAFHFFLHLLAHESVPKFVDIKLLAQDKFTGVLVFVSSGLSNFSIATLALDTALHGLFLVLNALLKLNDALLSILLLLLNVKHERVEDSLRLETVLLSLTVLVAF